MAAGAIAVVLSVPAVAHGPSHAPVPAAKPAIKAPGEELTDLRTRTSRSYERPNGSLTARVFAGPVNYRDGSGGWRAIDNTLARDGAAYTNVANSYDVRLPARLEDAPIRLVEGAHSITLQPVGAQGAAVVRANAATYLDAWPGADLSYTAHSESVKEAILLQDASAASSYAFRLDVSSGLRPRRSAGDGVEFLDAEKRVAMTLAPAWMRDARGVGRRVDTALKRDGAAWTVTLTADRGWLDDAKRRFPVTVDPTVGISANPDCLLSNESGLADSTICSEDFFEAGYGWAYAPHDHHGLLKFDVQAAIPAGADVLSARLGVHLRSSDSGVTKLIDARRVTSAWNGSVSWNKRDGANAWTTPGGDMAASEHGVSVNGSAPGWYQWRINDMVDGWNTGRYANNGVMLASSDSDSTLGAMMFDSAEVADASLRPYLDVDYDRRLGDREGFAYERFRLSDRIDLAVNPGSGNLNVSNRDVTIAGAPGPDLALSRNYNSLTNQWGAFSRWWWNTGNDFILQWHPNEVQVWGPSGYRVAFRRRPDGTFAGRCPDANIRCPGMDATITVGAPGSGQPAYTMTDHKTQTKWFFNNGGRLAKQEDRNGRAITYTYHSDNMRVSKITDSKGRETNVSYRPTATGQISRIVDPAGREFHYGYTDVLGWELLTSYTDPAGGVTQYAYDTDRRLSQITTPGNRITKIVYYASTHAHANKVKEIIRVTDPVAGTGPTTQFTYTTNRNGSSSAVVTDPLSHSTSYVFDTAGRPTKVTDAKNRPASTTYTTSGNVQEYYVATNTGLVPSGTLTHDTDGNLTESKVAVGTGSSDKLTSKTSFGPPQFGGANVGGSKWLPKFVIGEQDNAADSAGARGTKIEYENVQGNPTKIVKGTVSVLMSYANGADGKPNRLASTTDPRGKVTTYGYDAADNLKSIDPPLAGTTPDLGTTQLTYDGAGGDDLALSRVTKVTDGRGNQVLYEYDDLDRVKKLTYKSPTPTGSEEARFEYTYDLDGNLTQRVDYEALPAPGSSTTYGFTYDKLNRLTLETLPGSRTNAYTYDAASNLKTVTDAGGTVTYSYDEINRQTSIQEPGAASAIQFTYKDSGQSPVAPEVPLGQKNTITLPNGVATTKILDPAGRLLDTTSKNSGGTVLQRFSYLYNLGTTKAALVSQEKDKDNNTIDYVYDTLERLTSAVNSAGDDFAYEYDAASNVTSRTINATTPTRFRYNDANQLCWTNIQASTTLAACNAPPTGAITYTYDADGNQLTNVGRSSGVAQTATYNRRGQMNTLAGIAYAYAGAGQAQRISSGSTQMVNNVLGVASHTAGSAADYFTRAEAGVFMSQRRPSAAAPHRRLYPLPDRLGSTRTLTDETGAVARRFAYEPYGKGIAVPGAWTADTGLRFLGAEADRGVYRFGERWYDPSTFRWTQQDPLRQPDDLTQANRYTYADGNPVNNTDTSGLRPDGPAYYGKLVRCLYSDARGVRCPNKVAEAAARGCAKAIRTAGIIFAILRTRPDGRAVGLSCVIGSATEDPD